MEEEGGDEGKRGKSEEGRREKREEGNGAGTGRERDRGLSGNIGTKLHD